MFKNKFTKITFIAALQTAMIGGLLCGLVQQAHAAPVTGFNPGYIMSDNIFTNSKTMSADQVQAFLDSKVPVCDSQGRQSYAGTTRAAYAASRGVSTPFVCLKSYVENGYSAAQIIYNVSQQYQINPQVLIVLLQKEQGLVTDDWPWPTQYKTATGYGCPDTAPCDSQYYGLTNQLTWSAKMFRAIENNSSTWFTPYILGNNTINYSPNASCGGSTVNIQNRATQALYNYTPYQPNQAALNAGYGTGDSCSAYGNRNFYLYFSDWFGSPLYGNLVRTPENATVYLVSGTTKYPIANMETINALYPLGNISYVNQSYLDQLTSGAYLGRIIRSSEGTVYLYDSGIKLPFGSCTLVEAYGVPCGQSALLTEAQVNMLSTGPAMTNVLGTTSGKTFYMDGKKKEVYDQAALTAIGATMTGANILSESSLSGLALGTPIVREGVYTKARASGVVYAYTGSQLRKVDPNIQNSTVVSSLKAGVLDDASLAQLTSGTDIAGFIRSQGGVSYLLVDNGKLRLSDASAWQKTFTLLPDALLSQIPDAGTADPPYFVKSAGSGTVYALSDGKKRPIQGWSDLLAISAPNTNPSILVLSDYYTGSLPDGDVVLSPGKLVKTKNDATVYLVNGLTEKIPMNSFSPATELGATSLSIAPDDVMSHYTTAGHVLTSTVKCGSSQYVGMSSKLFDSAVGGSYYTQLSTINCNLLEKRAGASFLLGPDGTIYQLNVSDKHPIGGYQTYLNLGGTPQNTFKVTSDALSAVPTGSTL